ncbi:MAG: YqeG family HAD IIIA-type phosphatase [Ruminococcaceae bacterium]|nr:YqeG family HAD IIIA-type phosphatase [Oscillospiraceae bacterium]
MFNFLKPHFYFNSIHDVPITFYDENNIRAVLFDVDNTLEPYATSVPGDKTLELFASLREHGIKIAVISNNHEPRVKAFCEPLGVPYSFESGKPSSKKIHQAMEQLDVSKDETVLVGDQLFTDIWAANNSDIRGILVDKINDKESFFIKFKRVLEIPFVSYVKKKGYGRIK